MQARIIIVVIFCAATISSFVHSCFVHSFTLCAPGLSFDLYVRSSSFSFFFSLCFPSFHFLIFVETTFLLIQVYMYVRKQFRRRRFSVKTHFSHTSLVSVWIQLSVKVENHAFFKFSVKVDTKFSWNKFSCKKRWRKSNDID